MKATASGHPFRIELGRHIVADSGICGAQPTFKGTRIMVWIVLEQLDRGLTWAEIVREWDGRVSEEAIGEAIDRKSTRLNSSHTVISYAVFCLKKKNKPKDNEQVKQLNHT